MLTRWVSTTADRAWNEKSGPAPGAAEPNLRLTGERGRTWEGFGGCFNELGWLALSSLDESARGAVMASFFDPREGCRFSLCRLPIGASDYGAEWYSLNETDWDFAMAQFSIERDRHGLIPYIREALLFRPDLRLFASPWSPPTWMKFPRAYNYGTVIWQREYLDAYALYFVKFVQAYAAEGVTLHQIHPQNEPVADQKFPSCLWTGEQMRDFIRDHLGPAFRQHGLDCEIWLGTINSDDYDGWANTVLRDPGARAFISGVGYQWAGKWAVQRTAMAWPEMRIMQTENECGDGRNTWQYAEYVFGLLHHYISNGTTAYVYWNMILPPGGRSTWGWNQNAMITVNPVTHEVTHNPEFYVMKHFSHFVDPGATRLALTGPWAGNAVAFENSDGKAVLIVANPFGRVETLTFGGAGGTFSVELAPHSFNTLVVE